MTHATIQIFERWTRIISPGIQSAPHRSQSYFESRRNALRRCLKRVSVIDVGGVRDFGGQPETLLLRYNWPRIPSIVLCIPQ